MPPDELKEGSPGFSDVLLVISTAYEERTRDFGAFPLDACGVDRGAT